MTSWRLPLFCSKAELNPARALLTPTWLVALVVLALNDHLLKGAGLLPGVVTGKLSDFAGMIVAPVLLAALLRVRSRRGLLVCHAAVGAVFAAINLSPAAADAWTALMANIWPWRITVDPTDLIALPALALGWRVLVPAMTRPMPVLSPWVPRVAEASALAVGTFFCVATSDDGGQPPDDDGGPPQESVDGGEFDEGDVDYEDFDADVYLHNASDLDIRVRTRPLHPDVQLDCITVEEDPGLLLSESLFAEGQTVTLPPTTNIGVRDIFVERDCYAVRVEGDRFLAPFILFWHADDINVSFIDGDIDDPALHSEGAVLLTEDADHRVVVRESRSPVVFAVDDTPPKGAVLPGDDAERLGWSDPPFGEHQLAEVEVGPDGCVAVTLAGKQDRWYVCVPQGAFPFAADQWVDISDNFGAVDIVRVADPQDPVAVPLTQLTISRGNVLPAIGEVVLAASADYSYTVAPEPVCGTVARPDEITARFADSDVVRLFAGQSTKISTQDRELTLWVAHAEERVVLNPDCAEGPDELGPDVEIAALITSLEP
jgi:hypothetical protein